MAHLWAFFLLIDTAYLSANLFKFLTGVLWPPMLSLAIRLHTRLAAPEGKERLTGFKAYHGHVTTVRVTLVNAGWEAILMLPVWPCDAALQASVRIISNRKRQPDVWQRQIPVQVCLILVKPCLIA